MIEPILQRWLLSHIFGFRWWTISG